MELIEVTAFDEGQPYTIVVPVSEYICLKDDGKGAYSMMYFNYQFTIDKTGYFQVLDQLKTHTI